MSTYEVADRRPIASIFRHLGTLPVRWCVSLGIHPNAISIASIIAAGVAAMCFVFAGFMPWLCFVGVGFCFLRLYFNMLDGMVAIAANKVSATGEIANELPDRISDVLIFAGAAYGMMSVPSLGLWCATLSLLVAYVGTLGKAVGVHRDFSGPMSKPWRMVLLSIGVVVTGFQLMAPYAPPMVMAPVSGVYIACLVIAIGCVVTIIRRVWRIIAAVQRKATNTSNQLAGESHGHART